MSSRPWNKCGGIIPQVFRVIQNFGKSLALNAAFHHVSGDVVFTLDADMQDDPKEFTRFITKLDEGYDLVSGWKKNRMDGVEKRLSSKFFNNVTSTLSGVKLHDHNCGFKCFRKEVVKSLDLYGEMHRYVPVLAYRQGFRITEIAVEHHKRQQGSSHYGPERYMQGAFDSLTANFLLKYSDRPMYLFGKFGVGSILAGMIICLCVIALWIGGSLVSHEMLLVLGVLLILIGVLFLITGFLGNMLVEFSSHSRYTENHIKEII